MNILFNTFSIHQDPLGLRDLPVIEPERDGWNEIKSSLEEHRVMKNRRKSGFAWLAVAASLALAVMLVNRQVETESSLSSPEASHQLADSSATIGAEPASLDEMNNVDSLIALSQTLETQLKNLRSGTSSMPGNSAVYVAELEDLVAQVDGELSYSPDSVNLWGQRVNLLLDLAQIYQHHWETEYGQMASL
jgi:HPt (histidine-containing phosphotransfer) domain-containing protein